jgi:hypothetical protein
MCPFGFFPLTDLGALLYNWTGTNPRRRGWRRNPTGENNVIDRNYFVRQATTLLKLAQSTNDPKLAATLIDRAAKLKSQIDDAPPLQDQSPQAPDVERPA